MARFKKGEPFQMTGAELQNVRGCMCAYEGCVATFGGDMPTGWVWMNTYWSPTPQPNLMNVPYIHWYRDACLCPEHAQSLEHQLKFTGARYPISDHPLHEGGEA